MRIASDAFSASARASFCITAFALGTRFARSSVVVVIAFWVLWRSAINDFELQGDIVRKEVAAIEIGGDDIPWFRARSFRNSIADVPRVHDTESSEAGGAGASLSSTVRPNHSKKLLVNSERVSRLQPSPQDIAKCGVS